MGLAPPRMPTTMSPGRSSGFLEVHIHTQSAHLFFFMVLHSIHSIGIQDAPSPRGEPAPVISHLSAYVLHPILGRGAKVNLVNPQPTRTRTRSPERARPQRTWYVSYQGGGQEPTQKRPPGTLGRGAWKRGFYHFITVSFNTTVQVLGHTTTITNTPRSDA